MASIVLYLDLQSLPTHVNEVDQSGGVFCTKSLTDCSAAFFCGSGAPSIEHICMVSCDLRFDPDERIG